MLALSRWKVTLCVLAVFFGLVFTLPNLIPQKTLDSLPGFAPKQKLNLGLDLQGGSYLLMEVDTNALKNEHLNTLVESVRTSLTGAGVGYSGLSRVGDGISVHIDSHANVDKAFAALTKLKQPIDTTGVSDLDVTTDAGDVIHLNLSAQGMQTAALKAVDQSIENIRRRIDEQGTKEPSIARQGTDRIVIEAPGESDPERLKALIGKTAKLTFQMVDETVTPQDIAAGVIPPDDELLTQDPAPPSGPAMMPVKRLAVVTGEMLTSATQGFEQQTGKTIVNFAFNGEGARRFGQATSQNVGKRFAIVLDGKIIEAPSINVPILGGQGYIEGNFTPQSANDLAVLLRAGALPAPLNVIEQRTVGAELGADAVHAGQISAGVGFLVILVFIVLAYGLLFGGVAVAALFVNGLLLIAYLSVTGGTLTLPGIAGLILSLALAVDASVLIYERIRDEARAGHSPMAAADHGFRRALVSIIDANVTTLIAGAIMYWLGAGPVRGFALSLSVGVFTSVFSAVIISQVLLGWWFKTVKPKTLPIV